MKIILALLGLVILLPRRGDANFLRHVVEAEPNGKERMLQSCQQACQKDMCTKRGEDECMSEAEATADVKQDWCVGLGGNYKKWEGVGECGAMLKKPKYNCKKFSECVEDRHCSIYRSTGCDKSQAVDKAKWALNTCQAHQYDKVDAWNMACPLELYPYEEDDGEEEYDCVEFQSCVQRNHCREFPNVWCDSTQRSNKAKWARARCDEKSYVQADGWKQNCPLKKFKVVKQTDPVECNAYRECMVKVQYNQNIAKKLDAKVATCMSENRFATQCRSSCNANCPCNESDMKDCTELHDKCKTDKDSKKCFKNAQKKKDLRDCCCLDRSCKNSADGFNDCGFLKDLNRVGPDSSDDPPLPPPPKDFCSPDPCQNGGVCFNNQDKQMAMCKCPTKWYTGKHCELKIDRCSQDSPCGAHGTCYNKPSTTDGFVCVCDKNYDGKLCLRKISYCSPDPCKNGGVCINNQDKQTATCKCPKWYTGKRCEVEVDRCSSIVEPCNGRGTCVNKPSTDDGFVCVCDTDKGYTGKRCGAEIDYCKSNQCSIHSTCQNDRKNQSYRCVCDEGWEGRLCGRKIKTNYCSPDPCSGHGRCYNEPTTIAKFVCDCDPGYEDFDCSERVSYCSPNPCENGQCRNADNDRGYRCDCEQFWRGTNCDRLENQCASNPCQNGGSCRNDPNQSGGYRCICRENYFGARCEFGYGEETIEYRYFCDRQTACRCYDSDCESSRGTYDMYEDVTVEECQRKCNENGKCNGIEYNANQNQCEVHTDKMMDRKDVDDTTMCCEKQEISTVNRVPDIDCIVCTDEPTDWMLRNDKTCDNWPWGIPFRCNDSADNTEYPSWRQAHYCELSCAKARSSAPGGRNYPGRLPCCQLL